MQAYACDQCGQAYAKWVGKCEACGAWNSVQETKSIQAPASGAFRLGEIPEATHSQKISTRLSYLDRILGQGIPEGTVILVAGEPGIGKSTLLFQMMAQQLDSVLYVSGEESLGQIARRFRSIQKETSENLFVLSECRLHVILEQMKKIKPKMLVIDSVQMIILEDEGYAKGGHAGLREVTERLVEAAKQSGTILWIVGHVNKEGDIAGPKTLEHLVDTVLLFSAAEDSHLRILQVHKHRFGPSGELALLEISEKGLKEKEATASYWIRHHLSDVPGCALTPVLMGSRVVLVEVQALVVPSYFASPRRSTSGFDLNRLFLILAVLEKRLKIPFSRFDIYLNVVGGLKISDPGADLAVAAALLSAHSEKAVSRKRSYCAEIGLTGELRPVSSMNERARMAEQAGLETFVGAPAELSKAGKQRLELETRLDKALQNLV